MRLKLLILSFGLVGLLQLAPLIRGQEVDGSDLRREQIERDEKIKKLSIEEQLKLRAGQRKAAEDPVVQAALRKRNEAIQEFRAALRASMIKTDPSVEPILAKLAVQPVPIAKPKSPMSILQDP